VKTLALAFVGVFLVAGPAAAAGPADHNLPIVSVREGRGVYTVEAQFEVPQSPAVVRTVLTDYAQIPRFMPDVRTSVILHRTGNSAIVEQEAISKVLMFSKRVHLVLEVTEDADTIGFRDQCGQSFSLYEGTWSFSERGALTVVTYKLTARPAFEVPEFLLKRLLRRDAGQMIDRLQREVARRASQP
jgi:hypothetical protein